jgi:hypothetical protein
LNELRCDGSAHGGCEAACLLFWKEQWLKKAGPAGANANFSFSRFRAADPAVRQRCTEETLLRSTRHDPNQSESEVDYRFSCQATCVTRFTSPLPWWDVRQYFRDLLSGNVRFVEFISGLFLGAYNKLRSFRGHCDTHRLSGTRSRTPSENYDLKPGDLVRIKCTRDIRDTLDARGKNRGLTFTRDMVAFCDHEYRILRRVHKIIDERTGKLVSLAGGCLILDGVVCSGRLNRFCPRLTYQFWHDIWLSKLNEAASETRVPQIRRQVNPALRDGLPGTD